MELLDFFAVRVLGGRFVERATLPRMRRPLGEVLPRAQGAPPQYQRGTPARARSCPNCSGRSGSSKERGGKSVTGNVPDRNGQRRTQRVLEIPLRVSPLKGERGDYVLSFAVGGGAKELWNCLL